MPEKINLGEFSPEQLKDARQEAHKDAGQERADKREVNLEKQMAEYMVIGPGYTEPVG